MLPCRTRNGASTAPPPRPATARIDVPERSLVTRSIAICWIPDQNEPNVSHQRPDKSTVRLGSLAFHRSEVRLAMTNPWCVQEPADAVGLVATTYPPAEVFTTAGSWVPTLTVSTLALGASALAVSWTPVAVVNTSAVAVTVTRSREVRDMRTPGKGLRNNPGRYRLRDGQLRLRVLTITSRAVKAPW